MGHTFRINKKDGHTKSTIIDWSDKSDTPYNEGYIKEVDDTSTIQREITSIPSPFARLDLIKTALTRVCPASSTAPNDKLAKVLHGNSIYHKMVSDMLDVAQLFFEYDAKKELFKILVWERGKCLKDLKESSNLIHQIYGDALDKYLNQDAESNNFGSMEKVFILDYCGPDQRGMLHPIGATSPSTMFFSTANDESEISKHLLLGNDDKAFDPNYKALDQRDPEFIKYMYANYYHSEKFTEYYKELAKYLECIYNILPQSTKTDIDEIKDSKSYLTDHYQKLEIDDNSGNSVEVTINGSPLYKRKPGDINSDFEISSKKDLQDGQKKPLVLPITINSEYKKMEYYGGKFGEGIVVPKIDISPLNERRLPGIGNQYPYLTISDFLEDKIVKLPAEINKDSYFDGNFKSNDTKKPGFLLPVKKAYFDYFTINDLTGKTPSGKNTIEITPTPQIKGAVNVTLRIPVKKGEIEYVRTYSTVDKSPDSTNNDGVIVYAPEDFTVGIFPPVRFADEKDAHYRIALLCKQELSPSCQCELLNNGKGQETNYVVRNNSDSEDICSKVYLLEGKNFDSLYVTILSDKDRKEKICKGLLIPKFDNPHTTNGLIFAIDLGTSNTHIEYCPLDEATNPKPFAYGSDKPMMSLVCAPSDNIKDHINGEFLPESIGDNSPCHFPMRTVLCMDKNNSGINESGTSPYIAFGNASPAFTYNIKEIGAKYNNYISNLKWGKLDDDNKERIRCYIESLFLMIRNKVIQEGASISKTQIIWFYPLSMSSNKRSMFNTVWEAAYARYFNTNDDERKLESITESIAPYSYFQTVKPSVVDVVTIDIGGGTTDIVVADDKGVKLITSMRFAADAIFGTTLTNVKDGELNGIIKQFKKVFLKKLEKHSNLKGILENKTNGDCGNSSEIASFLFSLSDNPEIKENNMQDKVDFNTMLKEDTSQKIVFYIFYTSIIYHLAKLMKSQGLQMPKNIAFSGNGSKVISVLGDKNALGELAGHIFKLVSGDEFKHIEIILNSQNPKEATCKGGIFYHKKMGSNNRLPEPITLLGKKDEDTLGRDITYGNIEEQIYDSVREEVSNFRDLILVKIPNDCKLNLEDKFGINTDSIDLVTQTGLNEDYIAYIKKGIMIKQDSGEINNNQPVEETLFFYPIIGLMNKLSEKIYQKSSE